MIADFAIHQPDEEDGGMGNTDFPDDIDAVTSASLLKSGGELYGNTQYIATLIQQHTGGDLFLIQTEEKYPSVYEQIDEQGGEEHRSGIRPKLAAHVENMDDYSIIFLGYPIWYYDMPMAVYSFLEEYDLSGKTIIRGSETGPIIHPPAGQWSGAPGRRLLAGKRFPLPAGGTRFGSCRAPPGSRFPHLPHG